jgi:hypothetical protein
MTERIVISSFTKKFDKYTAEFIEFIKKNNIKPPSLQTTSGQGIALLTCEENRGKYVLRDDLETFFDALNLKTKDAIQCVNKCEQWGLRRSQTKGIYSIPYPFEYFPLHINKRKNVKIVGDRDEAINTIKQFVQENYIDVPNDKWQIGHKDPSKPTAENNVIYQPPIQGKYRDRYKFDDLGLTKYPTVSELLKNLDKYYSVEEQQELFDALSKKYIKHT